MGGPTAARGGATLRRRRGLAQEVGERGYDWEPGATSPPSEKCGPPGTCPRGEPLLGKSLQEPGGRRRGRPAERDDQLRGRKWRARGAGDTVPNPKWSWILWILCLWGAVQMGAALVLKGNQVEGRLRRVAVR